jgi:segregation and condensation protein B
MDSENLDNIVLALLFSADEPITIRKIASILEDVPASDIKSSVDNWRRKMDDESWSIVLERVAGGYQLSSRPQYAPYIARMYSGRRKLRLSKAALESLAIIAYKQPITRAEIEHVRGVGCGGVIANLLERSLIRITGKAKVLGAPFLYGTTPEFLEYLGLNSLQDLPSLEELEAILEREEGVASEPLDDGETPAPVEEGGEETAPAAARVGPDIDEPYNRPLGNEDPEAPHRGASDRREPEAGEDSEESTDEATASRKTDDRNE